MLTLGIETSCDETALALVKGGGIVSHSVASSIHLHKEFGGVIPEIASRHHMEYINFILKDVLQSAEKEISDIELVAATVRPGLVGALLVGLSMAKALSFACDIPFIGVDHLMAHLFAAFVGNSHIGFPFVGMIVSGGHTSLFLVRDIDDYELLAETSDDACGEAFDKVAKILNLGYPGGPAIEKAAGAAGGSVKKGLFPNKCLEGTLGFSFSGIKTAVLYHVRDRLAQRGVIRRHSFDVKKISDHTDSLKDSEVAEIAASFQDSVTEILSDKAISACVKTGVGRLVVGGGVTANTELRRKLSIKTRQRGISLYRPPKELCVDNGVMVAGLAERLYEKTGVGSELTVSASS